MQAPQVAEWAGHSVNVLMKVYAKCIDGEEEAARRRIEAALGAEPEPTASGGADQADTKPKEPDPPTRIRHDE